MYFVILLGRAWAAATTEGLMIYSLDSSMVFDPFDLDIEVTPNSTRKALAKGEYSTALILSFKLNEMKLKQEVLEHIPVSSGKCKKKNWESFDYMSFYECIKYMYKVQYMCT